MTLLTPVTGGVDENLREGRRQQAEGRIVDGPGSLGLYRIAFDSAQALASARDLFEASDLVALVAAQ